ncbi:alpha-L-rhamnosidase C-terminal domain-containing protein [uncultured Mitsuokella sp.]|uniref:alpha-L-rhamnosidase C-terminal domain-containing protein n=1 Tax=uncultured Mitsuokella sp. TaxID=453120 RepID=UPI00266FCCB3|nr:alpha-L-rhamnosidase C-terminal domain-containing protein [uncultured Mitsuokella sp.]
MAGIDTLDAGYHHLLLRPRLTKGLSFAEGSLDTLYGIVKSRWQLHGRHVQLDFTIPANCQADVYLPGTKNNKKLSLGSGQYHYDYEAEGDLETIYEELS